MIMIIRNIYLILIVIFLAGILAGQNTEQLRQLIGSAYLDNISYEFLERLSDEVGGRMPGSENSKKGLNMLEAELTAIGIETRREAFTMPGWVRGADRVETLSPLTKTLRASALGYVQKTPTFEAPLIFAGYGFEEDFEKGGVKDKIILVTSERAPKKRSPLRSQIIRYAAESEARAVLFLNSKKGALRLAGTASFSGEPAPIPAYTITFEEGKQLQRLLERHVDVQMRITTESYCREVETANLLAKLPGKVEDKIVVGAHFDSWDLAQGSTDNGLGTALLLELARLLKQMHPENYYTIEFVWFDGEELGLWGSKKYVEKHKNDKIIAMLNLDMPGSPHGFNVMGFSEYMPFFEQLKQKLAGFELDRGVINHPWTGSDHLHFLLAGIPSFTLTTFIDDDRVRYYHSAGDTFDKISLKYLCEAAAVCGVLLAGLANDQEITHERLSEQETIRMLEEHKIDEQLKSKDAWPFDEKK